MVRYEDVQDAAAAIRLKSDRVPEIVVVLGSGLGEVASVLGDAASIPYTELPHWPPAGVPGHHGRYVVGMIRGRVVGILCGRCHVYEGLGLGAVTFAVRAMGLLGVRTLVLTNAAGGINPRLAPGDLMLIDDHINMMGGSPLMGPNDERFGPRFPDMSEVYAPRLRMIAEQAAQRVGGSLQHGVYAAVPGPNYETPAEIRHLALIGADAVGMSTVPEALVARHMGIDVLGVSCIANMAAGAGRVPIDHRDVLDATNAVTGRFASLLEEIVDRI